MPEKRPNIVFINTDQWRYDCMSILGHPVVETPNLDGLAWNYPHTLGGELTRAGYQTQAIGKMHVYPQRWDAGFEDVILHDGFIHAYGTDRADDYEDWLGEQTKGEVTYYDHSLLPLMGGSDVEWRRYVHGEHAAGELSNHYITDGIHKLIWYSQTGVEQLFDIANDRQELRDLADDPASAKTLDRFRKALAAELAGREEGYSDGETLIVGRQPNSCLSHILPEDQR